MSRTTVRRTIDAPVDRVFDAVAHIESFKQASPSIKEIEFLTEEKRGVGTRFRETRVMNGREASTELEVKEYVPNERVRMVSDTGGTIWDTVFTVSPSGAESSELEMVMDARPHKFIARLVNPLIKGMVTRAIESDMDAVKQYCEQDCERSSS